MDNVTGFTFVFRHVQSFKCLLFITTPTGVRTHHPLAGSLLLWSALRLRQYTVHGRRQMRITPSIVPSSPSILWYPRRNRSQERWLLCGFPYYYFFFFRLLKPPSFSWLVIYWISTSSLLSTFSSSCQVGYNNMHNTFKSFTEHYDVLFLEYSWWTLTASVLLPFPLSSTILWCTYWNATGKSGGRPASFWKRWSRGISLLPITFWRDLRLYWGKLTISSSTSPICGNTWRRLYHPSSKRVLWNLGFLGDLSRVTVPYLAACFVAAILKELIYSLVRTLQVICTFSTMGLTWFYNL